MYLNKDNIAYLADRIERIGDGDSLRAVDLIKKVRAAAPQPPETEHALYAHLSDYIIIKRLPHQRAGAR